MTVDEMMVEFHTRNKQHIGNYDEPKHPPTAVLLLRFRLMLEELGELAVAVHEYDKIAIADGLADLTYVVVGTACAYGVRVAGCLSTSTGAQLNGNATPAPGVRCFILESLTEALHNLLATMYEDKPATQVKLRTRLLLEQLDIAAYQLGVPLLACFTEVHRSNMTKTALGCTVVGAKYAAGNPKGDGYSPPDLKKILGVSEVKS